MKKLTRDNLKTLKGGTGCSYKCCWDKQPSNCSRVATVSVEDSGSMSCVEGAHIVAV